jgi:hypothetical protein
VRINRAAWTLRGAGVRSVGHHAGRAKGANAGGATLGRRSHARTRTDYQRANSFGPNELRAIATSGDTMPFVWDFQL